MKFSVVVRIFLCLALAPFAAHALPKTAGGPGGVGTTDGTSKLIVWLKPINTATNGQIVGVLSPPDPWSDSSGSSNHFDYFNAAERPEWTNNAINGQAAVAFSGTDTLRMPASGQYTDTDAETVFVVHDRDDDSSFDAVLGDQSFNNNVYALYKDNDPDGWHWLMNEGGGPDASLRDAGRGVTTQGLQMIVGVSSIALGTIALYDQGGLLKSSAFATPSPSRRYDLSDTGSQALDGLIAEFVAFKTNLNTVQRYLVENYLSSKYDMTLTGRDFYAGDTTGNGDYDWDVCGVGQDGGTQVTDGGMSGFGIETTSGLNHGDWVLAGHNLQFQNTRLTTGVPAGMKRRWQRVWYLDKTGNLNVTLAFDHSDALLSDPTGGTDFALLYSATDSPYSFSALAVAESVNGDTVSFAVTDANLQDGYYTLASDEDIPAVSEVTGGTGPGGVGLVGATGDLVVWLKPTNSATGGTQVDPWYDSSGKTNDFSWFNSDRPDWINNAINGQTAAAFEGIDRLRMPASGTYTDNDAESLFVVHDRDDNADTDSVVGDDNINFPALWKKTSADGWQWGLVNTAGGKIDDAKHGVTTQGVQMIVGVRSIALANMSLYDQGGFLRENTSFTDTTPQTKYTLAKGGTPDAPFGGLIAEFIAFKTNLTTVQRYLVENYLCSEFDMTLTDRDFYAGDTAGNGDYDFDVFGIGRLSSNDQATVSGHMGLGIAAPWGMSDDDWILAGHKVPSNSIVSLNVQGKAFRRWARVWYVDVTAISHEIRLSFDFSDAGLTQEGADYELFYSAVNAFSWSTVDDAVASVDGDRLDFDVPLASMVDGYYTVAYQVEFGMLLLVH